MSDQEGGMDWLFNIDEAERGIYRKLAEAVTTRIFCAYTWASWFYRRMVGEKGTFTPEEGIRKLSGLVAERFKLPDRGVIRDGAWADLAIFDPQTFGEKGTIFEPNQVATGDHAGAVLRR